MNLGKLLGVLSPGVSATGLLGQNAQQGGIGALGAMSPLLALLLRHKNGGGDHSPGPKAPGPGGPVASPMAAAMGQPGAPPAPAPAPTVSAAPGMDPARRQRIAQMLLQYGGNAANPFQARPY